MRVLVTGASGYIGGQLIPVLQQAGHEVVALVRNCREMDVPTIVGDLLEPLSELPSDIDAAYYLVHSMMGRASNFEVLEARCARNFATAVGKTRAKQIIYLSALSVEPARSEHMASRRDVERILGQGSVPVTVLRAGIIIGPGSASFEIISDLVNKLPGMVAPRWVRSLCQPIGIGDVLFYLTQVLGDGRTYRRTFDIGGPDRISYLDMMRQLAQVWGVRRWILPVPVLTPKFSAYWLVFVTHIDFALARALINSLKGDAICNDDAIRRLYNHRPLSYRACLEEALQ